MRQFSLCVALLLVFLVVVSDAYVTGRRRSKRNPTDKLITTPGAEKNGKRYIIKFKKPTDDSEREDDDKEDKLDDILDSHDGSEVNNGDAIIFQGKEEDTKFATRSLEERSAAIATKREMRRSNPQLMDEHIQAKRLLRVHTKVQSFGETQEFKDIKVAGCTHKNEDNNECEGRLNENVFNGVVADVTSQEDLDNLLNDQDVEYVEEDIKIHIHTGCTPQTNAISYFWGLDHIDNTDGSAAQDNKYDHVADGGAGVYVYVVDTGVNVNHDEFEGRAEWGKTTCMGISGIACQDMVDKQGHGTHCAGTVAGKLGGVAKKANIIAVKALGDDGSGTSTSVISGLQWAFNDIKAKGRVGKAVLSMSLGGGKSQAENDLIDAGWRDGIPSIVAAGNEDSDACNVSPASADKAITVGSIAKDNSRSSFSNWGSCVNIFAPGSSITSAYHLDNVNFQTMSGTSMATPAVAGASAVFLSQVSSCNSPQDLYNWLMTWAAKDKVTDPKGSINYALQVPCSISCPSTTGNPATTTTTTTTTTAAPSSGEWQCGERRCFPTATGYICYTLVCN